jgi:hypothetical protein
MTEAAPISAVMRALADPTAERSNAGAISQRLKAPKQAGLVAERPGGRKVYYRAQPEGLEQLVEWMSDYGVFWHEPLQISEQLLQEIDP